MKLTGLSPATRTSPPGHGAPTPPWQRGSQASARMLQGQPPNALWSRPPDYAWAPGLSGGAR
eukprot:4606631-Pyramimonas_sp.AAC.1